MRKRILSLVAILAVVGSASCSQSLSPANNDEGLLVSASGRTEVAWDPLLVLTAFGRGATTVEATANVLPVLDALTDAVKRAVPVATIRVSDPGSGSFFRSKDTVARRAVVDAGGTDQAERILHAVLAIDAKGSCCAWRIILRPKLDAPVVQAARKDALRAARKKAGDLAAAAGVEAGSVIAIHEGGTTFPGNLSLPDRSFTEDGLRLMVEELRARPATSLTWLLSLEVRFAIA